MSDVRDNDTDLRKVVAVHEHRINATERAIENLATATHELRQDFVGAMHELNATITRVLIMGVLALVAERLIT